MSRRDAEARKEAHRLDKMLRERMSDANAAAEATMEDDPLGLGSDIFEHAQDAAAQPCEKLASDAAATDAGAAAATAAGPCDTRASDETFGHDVEPEDQLMPAAEHSDASTRGQPSAMSRRSR